MRKMSVPPNCRARSAAIRRVRAWPKCRYPVGDGAKYVLSPFKKAQLVVADEVLEQAAEAVRVIVADGVQAAMNKFNGKEATSD